jgi:UDP-N-acetylglucosamine 1-carboxyvinyltransferase
MSQLRLEGGVSLVGTVPIEGAKNAALPCLAATLLTDSSVRLQRVPRLRDVELILELIQSLGKRVEIGADAVAIGPGAGLREEAEHRYVQQMRASFLVLGPLLARLGRAVVPLPGGCTIGPRPIDLHLDGLAQLGAEVDPRDGEVELRAKRLRGARIHLRFPSVGATEQLLMAASLAEGETTIQGAAREPEVDDLTELLRSMGARIERTPDGYRVDGVPRLHGAAHEVIPDRIEASTYLLAAAMTRGDITATGVAPGHLTAVLEILRRLGGEIEEDGDRLRARFAERPRALRCSAGPYPAFPTDLQPPLAAALTVASGESHVRDPVFPERYGYVSALRRMGAQVQVADGTARIQGVEALHGAEVSIPDLRGGAALVLAALAAKGPCLLEDAEILDRGYARLIPKFTSLGAHIARHDAP